MKLLRVLGSTWGCLHDRSLQSCTHDENPEILDASTPEVPCVSSCRKESQYSWSHEVYKPEPGWSGKHSSLRASSALRLVSLRVETSVESGPLLSWPQPRQIQWEPLIVAYSWILHMARREPHTSPELNGSCKQNPSRALQHHRFKSGRRVVAQRFDSTTTLHKQSQDLRGSAHKSECSCP